MSHKIAFWQGIIKLLPGEKILKTTKGEMRNGAEKIKVTELTELYSPQSDRNELEI